MLAPAATVAPGALEATRDDNRSWHLPFAAILVVALALRLGWRALAGPESFWTDGYTFFFDLARNLAAGEGYGIGGNPTAFRVPLYPMVLAAVTGGERAFWPLLVFQALVSAGTVACAGLLGRDLFGRRAGLIAAAVTAFYPYYVIHDTSLAETGLFTFLTALGVLLLVRARRSGSWRLALASGAVLGLAVLTRATLAPFLAFAVLWLVVFPPPAERPRRRAAAALSAAALMVLAPWLAHSHAVTGRVALGTEFGAALWGGNHPLTFSHYPQGSIDRSRAAAFLALPPADRRELAELGGDEAAVSDWYLERGLAWIAAHPGAALAGAARKLGAAFGPLPSPRKGTLGNLVHALSYGPVAVLALVEMARRRRQWRDHLPIYALIALFAAVTAVLWGHTSHRSVLDVYLIVFAAPALVRFRRALAGGDADKRKAADRSAAFAVSGSEPGRT